MAFAGWLFGGDASWKLHGLVDLFELIPCSVFSLIWTELQQFAL